MDILGNSLCLINVSFSVLSSNVCIDFGKTFLKLKNFN